MISRKNRVLSGFLSFIMVVTVVLGILPPIEVHAISPEEGGEGSLYIKSPSQGDEINGYEDITIKWNAVSGAHHYWLTVKGTSINKNIGNRTSYTISYDDDIFVTDGKEYKIYVAAMDSSGNVLNKGSEWNAIYVINNMEASFEVSEDYLEFEADGGNDTFKIYSDSAYTITESLTWITLSSTSGSSDKTITVTCKENTSTSDREGTIKVKHTATGDTHTIDVYQEGATVYATVSSFKLSSYEVQEGESIKLSGTINGNGETIQAVQVTVFDADDHSKGGRHVRVTPGTSSYSLSNIPAIVTGTTVGTTSFKIEAGKSYDVVVYATLSNGKGFETDPTKTFDVTEVQASISGYALSSYEVQEGESISLSGTIDGNGKKITAVQITVFDADDHGKGGVHTRVTPGTTTYNLNKIPAIKTGTTVGNTSFKTVVGKSYDVVVFVTLENGEGFEGSDPSKTFDVIDKVQASINGYALSSYEVDSGASINLSGTISGNGETIDAVQVTVFDATDHTKGGRHIRVTPGTSTYNLSNIPAIITGTTVGSTSFKTEAGKSYDVVIYVTLSNGEGFETDPQKTFTIRSEVYATISGYSLSASSVNSGDSIRLNGTINGNGKKINAVQVTVFDADDHGKGGIHMRVTPGTSTYNLSNIPAIITGTTVGSTSFRTEAGKSYDVVVYVTLENGKGFKTDPTNTFSILIPAGTGILGDVNSDGLVTNLDRFIFNRYLNSMSGYTANMVNKESADIDGDGNLSEYDCAILTRHLAHWMGYEDLEAYYVGPSVPPITNTLKWYVQYSSNTINIEVSLISGDIDTSKNYLFVAEDVNGLHYSAIIPAGNTSALFSIKNLQMPRGCKYTYYVVPEGIALAAAGKSNYYVSESVVPLYNGNMITSVKSAGKTVLSGGNVSIGNSLSVNWDGSYGVDNFNLVASVNGKTIYNKTFTHSGPGTVIIDGALLEVGTLTITGTVIPPVGSGLINQISTWTAIVVEAGEYVSIPYSSNDSSYNTYHQIVLLKSDGTSEVINGNIKHDFSRTEVSLSYRDEGSGHSAWEDTYEICACGVTRKVSSALKYNYTGKVNEINEHTMHTDKNLDYKCEKCGGNVPRFSSGSPSNNSYYVEYKGKAYPIAIPSYDVEKGSNYDINAGGWKTVLEKYYKNTDFDCASFIGNLELDDAGLVASGIGLFQQILQSHDTQKLGIVLQEKEGDSSVRRAVILLGNNKVYTRGYTDSTIVFSSKCTNNMLFYYVDLPDGINITEGLEISDWLIRDYSGLALPTTGWADDEDYLYDIVKVYSNQWLQESFCSYLTFDSDGNAITVERIMEDDRFELKAYYDGTMVAMIVNNTFLNWFTTPAIKEDLKMQLLAPTKVDASILLSKINGDLTIKKAN